LSSGGFTRLLARMALPVAALELKASAVKGATGGKSLLAVDRRPRICLVAF
jgi:hypothetical protein